MVTHAISTLSVRLVASQWPGRSSDAPSQDIAIKVKTIRSSLNSQFNIPIGGSTSGGPSMHLTICDKRLALFNHERPEPLHVTRKDPQ
jgi:hypothetical protein